MNSVDLKEVNHDAACCDDINGFSGPGAMLGWYLTLAGCMVTWALHPERKKKDSIDADMLTFLLLPLTAAAQLISLSRTVSSTQFASLCVCQRRCAIEAPAKVVFAFLNLAVVLLYPLSVTHHRKRCTAIVVAVITCVGSEYYVYNVALDDNPGLTLPSEILRSRYIVAPICNTIVSCDLVDPIFWRFFSRRTKRRERLENQTTPDILMPRDDEAEKKSAWGIRAAMVVWGGAGNLLSNTRMRWITTPYMRFWTIDWVGWFFPASPFKIGNIEQTTGAAGGVILLGFNLYSTGVSLSRERQMRIAKERKERDMLAKQRERKWHGHERDQAYKHE